MDGQTDRRLTWRDCARFGQVLVLMILLGVYVFFLAPLTSQGHDKDWSHLWLGGRMIVTGHADRLYDPHAQVEVYRQADPEKKSPTVWSARNEIVGGFFYPPPTALGYAALAWLPMRHAAVVNAYLNLALALIVAVVLAKVLRNRLPWYTISIALLAYPPFFVNLSLGQNGIISLVLLVISWWLVGEKKDLLAGVVLGLLIFKPNWLLAVAWLPLIHGRWRVLAGMIIGADAVALATVLILGIDPFLQYAEMFGHLTDLEQLPNYNLALTYNGLSVFRKWFGIGALADCVGLLSCALVALTTWKVTWSHRKPGGRSFPLVIGCSAAAMLWVNPHLYYYDLMLTVVAVAAMLLTWDKLGVPGRITVCIIAAVAYLAVPWDDEVMWSWPWRRFLPVPSIATLALWAWFVCRLALHERLGDQPKGAFATMMDKGRRR